MNGFAAVGIGQAISRGFRRRIDAPRGLMAQDAAAFIQSNQRAWRDVIGDHSADASADHIIARLRTTTGAGRALAAQPEVSNANSAFGG